MYLGLIYPEIKNKYIFYSKYIDKISYINTEADTICFSISSLTKM